MVADFFAVVASEVNVCERRLNALRLLIVGTIVAECVLRRLMLLEVTGLEPATSCLQSRHSTLELHPLFTLKNNVELLVCYR